MIRPRLRVITPPPLAVTLEQAKANSRVADAAEDSLVLDRIRSAGETLERFCDRAFGPQTLEAVLAGFPAGAIDLPRGPATGITSITYLDAAGTPTALAAAGVWEFEELSDPGTIHLLGSWPTTSASRSSVVVRYTAGTAWPSDVQQAVLLLVGHWFDTRNAATLDPMHDIPLGVAWLLERHRRLFA